MWYIPAGGQFRTRRKHQKIRCPFCNFTSRKISEQWGGNQLRICTKNGHVFRYSYLDEALSQLKMNYKIPGWSKR